MDSSAEQLLATNKPRPSLHWRWATRSHISRGSEQMPKATDILCYAIMLPGRKPSFWAGFRPDANREIFKIGRSSNSALRPACRPAGGPNFRLPRLESDRNPARKPDSQEGMEPGTMDSSTEQLLATNPDQACTGGGPLGPIRPGAANRCRRQLISHVAP